MTLKTQKALAKLNEFSDKFYIPSDELVVMTYANTPKWLRLYCYLMERK